MTTTTTDATATGIVGGGTSVYFQSRM